MTSQFERREYAEKCRALASGPSEEGRREVLRMADIWESVARERRRRQPDLVFDPKNLWATGLRAQFDEVFKEPMPDRFRDLLKQLEDMDSRGRTYGANPSST
jgi:hypothetical protein